jgi:hypothetical protein
MRLANSDAVCNECGDDGAIATIAFKWLCRPCIEKLVALVATSEAPDTRSPRTGMKL